MASSYPSIIAVIPEPQATDRLNSPSHSALHQTENSEIEQTQRFIGTLPASAVGTLLYDVRSPASSGGGHIQAANTGGTGQTSYNKGDILVAQSSSALSKLAVSSTIGDVLTVDTGSPVGIKWGAFSFGNKVAVNPASVSLAAAALTGQDNQIFVASVIGSTLGTTNAIRFIGSIPVFSGGGAGGGNGDFTFKLKYGGDTVISTTMGATASILNANGTIEGVLYNTSVSSQLGFLQVGIYNNSYTPATDGSGGGVRIGNTFGRGTSSINSAAPQDLTITVQTSGNNAKNSILAASFIVEKIS